MPSPTGTLAWAASLPGLWTDAANWTVLSGADTVPGAQDDVIIAQPLNYTVTVSGTQAVNSLTLNGPGAKLAIGGTLFVANTVHDQAGTIIATNATLDGGTYDIAGGSATIDSSTLIGVTWQGTLGVTGTVDIQSGLTLAGPGGTGAGTLVITGTTLDLHDASTTLDNATILLSPIQLGATGAIHTTAPGASLTLGPNLLLDISASRGVANLGGTADVVNHGTIVGNGAFGGNMVLGASLTNDGTIISTVGQDPFGPSGSLTNTGSIAIGLVGNPGSSTIRVNGNLTGAGRIQSGNTAAIIVGGTIGPGVDIVRSNGTLAITAQSISPAATIEGFTSNDLIDLTGLTFDGNLNPFWSGTPAGGTLTIKDGATVVATLNLTGIANGATFSLAGGLAGTDITTSNAPCFAQGTRIDTPTGPVPVEQLRIGDQVLNPWGETLEITWLGHRRTDCRCHPRPWDVQPIRVQANAFAPGQPRHPLLLSPDHAVYLPAPSGTQDVLIPVRYLINGTTIAQQTVDTVTYWHVELFRHDVLLAEGLPCESYLDTGNRSAFDNAGATTLHPDFARDSWSSIACAPLVLGGPALTAARRHLLARAETLGHALTPDPALQLLANNTPIPHHQIGTRIHATLPPGTTTLRLLSRIWTPAHTRPDESDTRHLGIAIAHLHADGHPIPLASAHFTTGWHAPEPAWRWTTGSAVVALDGPSGVSFDLALTGTYWHQPATTENRLTASA